MILTNKIIVCLAALLLIPNITILAEEKNEGSLFDTDFNSKMTEIKSKTFMLYAKTRTFNYKGDVSVKQGDLLLTSELLDGSYSVDNQIQDLVAKNNVVITKGPDIKARGTNAVYSSKAQTLVLTGNPEIEQNQSILQADKITLFLKDNKSLAEGDVHVKIIDENQK
jgi:lipopolysaccharide transport protein LptA